MSLRQVVKSGFAPCRTLPSKKSAAALFAIFGSSFTGLVRYVFGQWIPSFEQLIYNKVRTLPSWNLDCANIL